MHDRDLVQIDQGGQLLEFADLVIVMRIKDARRRKMLIDTLEEMRGIVDQLDSLFDLSLILKAESAEAGVHLQMQLEAVRHAGLEHRSEVFDIGDRQRQVEIGSLSEALDRDRLQTENGNMRVIDAQILRFFDRGYREIADTAVMEGFHRTHAVSVGVALDDRDIASVFRIFFQYRFDVSRQTR